MLIYFRTAHSSWPHWRTTSSKWAPQTSSATCHINKTSSTATNSPLPGRANSDKILTRGIRNHMPTPDQSQWILKFFSHWKTFVAVSPSPTRQDWADCPVSSDSLSTCEPARETKSRSSAARLTGTTSTTLLGSESSAVVEPGDHGDLSLSLLIVLCVMSDQTQSVSWTSSRAPVQFCFILIFLWAIFRYNMNLWTVICKFHIICKFLIIIFTFWGTLRPNFI